MVRFIPTSWSQPGRQRISCIVVSVVALLLIGGCSHLHESRTAFSEANDLFAQGNYAGALRTYQEIKVKYPSSADRALFEMGIIHSHPANGQKDYPQALETFRELITRYPESSYRKDSEQLTFTITNVVFKDRTIAAQQTHIETLRNELTSNGSEIAALKRQVAALQQELRERESEISRLQQKKEAVVILRGPADRVLIEKGERRLTLLAQGKVLKIYQIALGGNPVGPKERQGDHKTPEGIYTIDGRNRNSRFHLSLHVSYPNEKDRKRARTLGVPPGGDIMIHGIKDGFGWAGEKHAEVDWTKGCIAVSDEEIEEIDRLVPIGTTVEIRP